MRWIHDSTIYGIAAMLLAVVTPGVVRGQDAPDAKQQVAELRAMVLKLQARVDELEARLPAPQVPPTSQSKSPPAPEPTTLAGTTVNFLIDGYYGYNFNAPIGRANRLRAYDVLSNSFSLNQAALVLENAVDPAKGKRWGGRLDLQWGQATQTLQGNPANEPRPEIYRTVFQAFGTYIVPLGNGVNVDFGKWASSLGVEANYTKDQMNYSRSYWFNFLPFYHMGARVGYQASDKLRINYWITNGAQQTEDFNGFKDQLGGLVWQPNKNISWTFNYYMGQENPDTIYFQSGAPPQPNLPVNQGVPFEPISNPPTGKLHIFDTYASLQATRALTVALEADYVIQRMYTYSPPAHVSGGAAYAQYKFTPKFSLAARAEYLSDRGGLFSGSNQALKETTLTASYAFGQGFLLRGEGRYDFSNQSYFYTSTPGVLKKSQTTATLGLVWWFGGKQGTW